MMNCKFTPLAKSLTPFLLFIFILSTIEFHCSEDKKDKDFVLRIRLADEPDCLHPVVSQSSLATQIEVLIMPPLFEFSPNKLEFSPILVKSMVDPVIVNDSTVSYTYELQENAVWEDGQPLTVDDIIYTIKSTLNPCIRNKTYAGFFKNIRDVKSTSSNNKTVTFLINKNYMQGQEMSGNYCIYPEHIYDPNSVLRKFSLQDLMHKDSANWSAEEWNNLKSYGSEYQSQKFCKEKIVGCGPYKLLTWQSGSKIILEKKKNWWGDSLVSKYPLLISKPDRIEYWIMPEEASALLELKNGNIDIISELTPKVFEELKDKDSDKLNFATPTLMQYMYIDINHRNPVLSNLKVRMALSHLINVDQFIKEQYNGLALRINSPVHPSKSYYNSSIESIKYDPLKATQLLKEDGWKDTNGDGSLDKKINGKTQELAFRFYLTNKETSKKFGLLLQEECKKVGIKIDLIPKEAASLMNDLNELNFDLVLIAQRQSPSLWDPFQMYSSSNTKAGGFNKSGYATSKSDSIIASIRNAGTENERNKLYLEFQKILHDEVVQIYLFSPLERIVYSKRINLVESSRRPGYYEGMITRK
ncbi:MAG: ABC transporter substrate-binding protein [Saprospiraceae bacterium]